MNRQRILKMEVLRDNFIILRYSVPDSIALLELLNKCKPFNITDRPIAIITWEYVVESLKQQGKIALKDYWDGTLLEQHLKIHFYHLSVQGKLKSITGCQLACPSEIDGIATSSTTEEVLKHQKLLSTLFGAWDTAEVKAELAKLEQHSGSGSIPTHSLFELASTRAKDNRVKAVNNNTINVTMKYADDGIPDEVNNILLEDLVGLLTPPIGIDISQWLSGLRQIEMNTIGDMGGWGSSKDPSRFHKKLIGSVGILGCPVDGLPFRQWIGGIRYHHVEKALSMLKLDQSEAEAQNTPPKSSPADSVLLRDLWLQALIRSDQYPNWLENLEKNGVNTVGDVGGWKNAEVKFANQIFQTLANLQVYLPEHVRRDIRKMKFSDLLAAQEDMMRNLNVVNDGAEVGSAVASTLTPDVASASASTSAPTFAPVVATTTGSAVALVSASASNSTQRRQGTRICDEETVMDDDGSVFSIIPAGPEPTTPRKENRNNEDDGSGLEALSGDMGLGEIVASRRVSSKRKIESPAKGLSPAHKYTTIENLGQQLRIPPRSAPASAFPSSRKAEKRALTPKSARAFESMKSVTTESQPSPSVVAAATLQDRGTIPGDIDNVGDSSRDLDGDSNMVNEEDIKGKRPAKRH